jgi:hypothetical protein
MPSRNIRNTAILASVEATYGVDPTPTGAANAMLVSNVNINPLNAQYVSRALVRPFMGASEQLVGTAFKEVSFDVELVGSGTAGTAPAWGPLLRACGFSQTLTASTRVDYLPVTSTPDSVTIYAFSDGVRHVLRGARGTVQIRAVVGEIPRMQFRFQGIDGGDTAVTNPAVTLTAFLLPQAVNDANTGDTIFGGTHSSSGAPAITGGTAYPSQGLEIDMGLSVNFTPMLGQETVDLTDRDATGNITMDLTEAQEITLLGNVRNATLQSVGLLHGTVTGRRSLIWLPNVQLTNPQKPDVNGKLVQRFDMGLKPSSGNDEVRIVTSF